MKLSKMHLKTLREVPNEAEIPSHILMLRSGMIRKLASGVYGFMPLGWRTLRKIEGIIREEMDAAGGQEIHMSAIQPSELWEESGALEYTVEPLCDYRAADDLGSAAGAVFRAEITKLGPLPESEIGETRLFETVPENLTYPHIAPVLFAYEAEQRA